jgi:hypothetical protein
MTTIHNPSRTAFSTIIRIPKSGTVTPGGI